MMRVCYTRPVVAGLLAVCACWAHGQTTIWLNWANSDSQLDACWSSAGFGSGQALTTTERTQIRSGVQSELGAIYNGFLSTFTDIQPGVGNYHRLVYGNTTTTSGLFGQAQRLDWRNPNKNDSADIYVANFSGLISASSFSRSTNLDRLIHGLAGTSAHELGHNLGLQHYDDYGDPGITPANYNNTGGLQNNHIMATGQTGINSDQRATLRSFSQLEKVKLEFAEGLAPVLGTTINESVGAHNNLATAQGVSGNFLPLSGVNAINIAGSLGTSSEQDWYSFSATNGSLITANILANDVGASGIDSILTLFDSGGNQLRTNDDITFSNNTIFGSGGYGTDSLLLNVPITTAGTYYMRVTAFGSTSGSYNLLMTGLQGVPEPATLVTLGIATLATMRRRSRRGKPTG